MTRTKSQMISVPQYNLSPHSLPEVARKYPLDCALSAHRHEDRGLDRAMRGGESAAAGPGGGIGGEKLAHWSGEKCLQLSRSRRETTHEKPFV